MENQVKYNKPQPLLNMTIVYTSLVHKKPVLKVRKVQIRVPMAKRPVMDFENLPDSVQHIVQIVAENMNTNSVSILSDSRRRHIVEARHVAMYLTSEYINSSQTVLGKWFNRDHSTLYHAIDQVNGFKEFDKKFNTKFNKIEAMVRNKLGIGENNLLDNQ